MKALPIIGILVAASFGLSFARAAQAQTDTELRLGEIMAGSKHEHKGSKIGEKYVGKPKHIRAGMKLYHKVNCVGCHFDGGGGMGPPLIDEEWVYGGSIDHIAASIRDGRPNGMPSFHAILEDEEIWQLAAYVEDGLKEHPHGEGTNEHEHGDGGKTKPTDKDAKDRPEGKEPQHKTGAKTPTEDNGAKEDQPNAGTKGHSH